MRTRNVAGALGVEVRGLDLERLTDATVDTVRQLVLEHLVVFFPEQHLTVGGQRRLGQALGEIVSNSYTPVADAEHPGVTLHRLEDGYVADVWHSDGQPRPAPVKFTIFRMVQSPQRGGDTMWTNQYRVYERLSAPLRDLLDGLSTVQRSLVNLNEQSTHRAVITHPETGRKLVYVSKAHTVRFVEMSEAESRPILDYLVGLSLSPENTCRFNWSDGDVGIWDNLATVHYDVNDFDEPRVFHRVMVQGPELARRADRWPAYEDGVPRTMVRNDGTKGVVGHFTERLWDNADTTVAT